MTLSACSAAFAAMSTALLCIAILNGRTTDDLLQGRTQTRLMKFDTYQLDAPNNDQTAVNWDAEDGLVSSLPRRRYGRRAISSYGNQGSDPKGVAWLMVSAVRWMKRHGTHNVY